MAAHDHLPSTSVAADEQSLAKKAKIERSCLRNIEIGDPVQLEAVSQAQQDVASPVNNFLKHGKPLQHWDPPEDVGPLLDDASASQLAGCVSKTCAKLVGWAVTKKKHPNDVEVGSAFRVINEELLEETGGLTHKQQGEVVDYALTCAKLAIEKYLAKTDPKFAELAAFEEAACRKDLDKAAEGWETWNGMESSKGKAMALSQGTSTRHRRCGHDLATSACRDSL
jgi:hypothetical protein